MVKAMGYILMLGVVWGGSSRIQAYKMFCLKVAS